MVAKLFFAGKSGDAVIAADAAVAGAASLVPWFIGLPAWDTHYAFENPGEKYQRVPSWVLWLPVLPGYVGILAGSLLWLLDGSLATRGAGTLEIIFIAGAVLLVVGSAGLVLHASSGHPERGTTPWRTALANLLLGALFGLLLWFLPKP